MTPDKDPADAPQSPREQSRDATLWALRAQVGHRDALELLLRSVQPSLRRYIRRLTSDGDAEDVLQDVLIAIARNVRWLVEPKLFRPWAFRNCESRIVQPPAPQITRGLLLLGFVFSMLMPPIQQGTVDATNTPSIASNRVIPLKVLWISAAMQLFFVACATAVVRAHVSKITRAVLRASKLGGNRRGLTGKERGRT